jgi:GTPase-activating protein BEM2
MQYLRSSVDARLRQEAGRKLHGLDANQDYVKRLILGSGGTVISLYNGDLRLVVQSGGFESESSSRPSSHTLSRPPSSVVDHGAEKSLG